MSNTAFRGFGGPQGIFSGLAFMGQLVLILCLGMFISESYMEHVADGLGMPVDKLRVSGPMDYRVISTPLICPRK